MIKQLNLKNWKSYSDATLYIDPFCFVIGTNASGKSNILDALTFLSLTAKSVSIMEAVKQVRGGIDWLIQKDCDSFKISIIADGNSKSEELQYSMECRKCGGTNREIEIAYEELSLINNTTNVTKKLFATNKVKCEYGKAVIPTTFLTEKKGPNKTIEDVKRSVSVLSQLDGLLIVKSVKTYGQIVKFALEKVFVLFPDMSLMRDYQPLSDTLAPNASNLAAVIAAQHDAKKAEIEDLITKYVKPLPEKDIVRVWTERIGRFGSDAMLYSEESWNNTDSVQMDARGMSDGTLRFIAIIASLLLLPEKSLLLIEEVDNGLHPSRTSELVQTLKELGDKRHIDILCTTHNPVLIDSLGVKMLPFISYVKRNEVTGASEIKLLEQKENLAKLLSAGGFGYLMINDKL